MAPRRMIWPRAFMTACDPETGRPFDMAEMIDQVAIFFLAGHETSASTLSWALYLLATHPDWQDQASTEAATLAEASRGFKA